MLTRRALIVSLITAPLAAKFAAIQRAAVAIESEEIVWFASGGHIGPTIIYLVGEQCSEYLLPLPRDGLIVKNNDTISFDYGDKLVTLS